MTCENKTVTVKLDGKYISVPSGTLLSELLHDDMPCGGHGKCGKCKVRACGDISPLGSAETRLLTQDEISSGIRLACTARVYGYAEIEKIIRAGEANIITSHTDSDFNLDAAFKGYGVAIDVGTTTVAAELYSDAGTLLAEEARLNTQGELGADVISRIEADLSGNGGKLKEKITSLLSDMISALAAKAGISEREIRGAVIVGNTAMLHFLVGESTKPLSSAPFIAKRLFGETATARDVGLTSLNPAAEIYFPPCISAFVGADTVAAILSSGMLDVSGSSLLVDIGTNGEMALASKGRLLVCSTAAGPAFEGVGISFGMRGEAGAIDRVSITEGELVSHVIGDVPARGICGSGLVDAAACMLDLDLMDESGYIDDEEVLLCGGISVNQEDVRVLQLAKSAIFAGISTLLDSCGEEDQDIKLYIAGGFGSYLNMESAAKISLIPERFVKNSSVIGNAALGGAAMLLLNRASREIAAEIAKKAELISLAGSSVFADYYINGMMF